MVFGQRSGRGDAPGCGGPGPVRRFAIWTGISTDADMAIQRLRQTICRRSQSTQQYRSTWLSAPAPPPRNLTQAQHVAEGKLLRNDVAAWRIGASSCRSEIFLKDANQCDSQAYSFR